MDSLTPDDIKCVTRKPSPADIQEGIKNTTRRPRIVDAKPVAELLGVKPFRVYDLAQRNLIPHIRMGRQVRFDLNKVEAWLESGGEALPGGWRQEAVQ